MSEITTDVVTHLADLARIALTDDEITQLAHQLSQIDDAVAKVTEVATDDVPATSHPLPLTNVMRDDVVGPTLTPDEALAASPAREGNYFTVPTILGED